MNWIKQKSGDKNQPLQQKKMMTEWCMTSADIDGDPWEHLAAEIYQSEDWIG
jgi:hypothetical protein